MKTDESKLKNPNRVRNKYGNAEVIIVGDVDNPMVQDETLLRLLRRRRQHRNPSGFVVEIDHDLRASFPDAEAVNLALRALVRAAER